MTYRRRNRWIRRLAVGLAFAAFAAPAAARPDANGAGVQIVDPYLTDVFVRPGEEQALPDGGTPIAPSANAASVHEAQPVGNPWAPNWNDAIALGLGTLGVALVLGLAIGYSRRPRIAGL